MNEVIPIWKTEGSIGRSLITLEDENKIIPDSPISIFSIAKKFNLNKLIVIDDSFIYFPKLFKNCNKNNIQLIFGITFNICNDVNDKSESSLFTNSKICVLIRNSQGYKDLIKLHNAINGDANNFYYNARGDWNIVKKYWTENLQLIFPSYDNFIHVNYLNNGQCVPDWGQIKPVMFYSSQELPYDDILNNVIKNYAKNNKVECSEVHNICYFKNRDFKYYSVFRAIDNRSKFNNPNVNFLSSDSFSFESFCKKTGVKFDE